MVKNELLMQFQADILGVPVIRPKISETTALGAAYAAGLATGYWKDLDELKKNWGLDKEWKPRMDSKRREELFQGWKKAIERTFQLDLVQKSVENVKGYNICNNKTEKDAWREHG